MINDTISDMLTRIRNANLAKKRTVEVLNTKINKQISEILEKQGYIESFKMPLKIQISSKNTKPLNEFNLITITLKYNNKKPCITNLKRLSSSTFNIYSKTKNIPKILSGIGTIIISTSQGLMTDKEARLKNLGGKLLFSIW